MSHQLDNFIQTYGEAGKVVLKAYVEANPLNTPQYVIEDFYLIYAKEFIDFWDWVSKYGDIDVNVVLILVMHTFLSRWDFDELPVSVEAFVEEITTSISHGFVDLGLL